MSIEKLRPSFAFDCERLEQLKGIVPEAFAALGIDYRHITADTLDWWQPAPPTSDKLTGLDTN